MNFDTNSALKDLYEIELATVPDGNLITNLKTKSTPKRLFRAQSNLEQIKVFLPPVNLESVDANTQRNLFKKKPLISREKQHKTKHEGDKMNLETKAEHRKLRMKSKKLKTVKQEKIIDRLHDDTKKMMCQLQRQYTVPKAKEI